MAWKEINKEGLAFLASVAIQILPTLTNPAVDWLTKLFTISILVIFIIVLMYAPEDKKGI